MKAYLLANWKTFSRVAFVLLVYVFVRKYPLTTDQREDLMLFVVASGVWAGLAPGIRAARREDDPR